MGDGGQGAQEPFGVYRTLVVEMGVAQEPVVCPGQDVGAGIIGVAVSPYQNAHVEDNQSHDGVQEIAVVEGDGQGGHSSVAEGDALHHAPDAEVPQVEGAAVAGHVKPVDGQPDEEQQGRALAYLSEYGGRWFE